MYVCNDCETELRIEDYLVSGFLQLNNEIDLFSGTFISSNTVTRSSFASWLCLGTVPVVRYCTFEPADWHTVPGTVQETVPSVLVVIRQKKGWVR